MNVVLFKGSCDSVLMKCMYIALIKTYINAVTTEMI